MTWSPHVKLFSVVILSYQNHRYIVTITVKYPQTLNKT